MPRDVNKKDDNGSESKRVAVDDVGNGITSGHDDEKERTSKTATGTTSSTRLTIASVTKEQAVKKENVGLRLASVRLDYGNQSDHDDDSETASRTDSVLPGAVAMEGRNSSNNGTANDSDGHAARRERRRTPSPPTPPLITTNDMEQHTTDPKLLVQAEIAPDVEQAIASALAEHERQQQANIVSAVEIYPLPDSIGEGSGNNSTGNNNGVWIGKCTSSWPRIFLLLIVVLLTVSAVVVGIVFIAEKDSDAASSIEKDDFAEAPSANTTSASPSSTEADVIDNGESGGNQGGGGARGGMIVPLYTWPTLDNSGQNCISEDYIKIATTQIASQTIVIVNPNQGPNYNNDAWTKQSFDVCISYLHDHGVIVIGYVATKSPIAAAVDSSTNNNASDSYRDLASVKSDIDTWFDEFDGVQGIFIDGIDDLWSWETHGWNSLDAMVDYHHALVDHVLTKSEESYAVMNPGGAYPPGLMEPYYANRRVISVVFEATQSEYQPENCIDQLWTSERGSFARGPWCRYVPGWDETEALKSAIDDESILPEQNAAIVYQASGNITEAVVLSIVNNIGWFYITDGESGSSGVPTQDVLDEQVAALSLVASPVKDASGLLIPLLSRPKLDDLEENCANEEYIRIATSTIASQMIVMVNPNDGPDYEDDLQLKKAFDICISYLQDNSVEVIGYVQTKVGDPVYTGYRDIEDVKADVDFWNIEYNVDGIFIDGVSNRWYYENDWDSLKKLTEFSTGLVDYVLTKYNRAVMNPAYAYNEEIMEKYYGDDRVLVVVYNLDQQQYQRENCEDILWTTDQGSFDEGPWCGFVPIWDEIEPLVNKMESGVIPNKQSAAIIFDATEGNISHAIALGVEAGIGWFYLTDNVEGGLPSHRVLDEQVTAVLAF